MRVLALFLGLLLLAAAPLPPVGPAQAQQSGERATKPLAQVLKAIGKQIPGRALHAEKRDGDGRPVYRIKWLGQDGRVRWVIADARSGEILDVR